MCLHSHKSPGCRSQCPVGLYSANMVVGICASNFAHEWGCHNYQPKIFPLPLRILKLSLPLGSASGALCLSEKQAVRHVCGS